MAKSKRKHSKKRRRSSSGSDSSGTSGHGSDCERTGRRVRTETRVTVAESKDISMPSRYDGYGGKLFEYDCAGDQENRFYGSLYDPPRYDLATRRDLRTGKWIVPRKHPVVGPTTSAGSSVDKESGRYFGDAARKRERNARQKRLRLAYSEKRLGRQRNRDQNASELVFIPLPALLDGEKQSIDPDSAEPSGSGEELLLMNTESENMEQYLVTRNKEFNIHLATNPLDISLWLDFMAFQEQSLRLSRGKSLAHAESLVREKQLAILDKAIQRNPSSRELQLVKLNMNLHASVSTDSACMSKEIEALLAKDPTNDELWLRLVECQQQSFAGFSMPSIRELFARMIANLRKEVTNSLNAKTHQQDSRQGSILVFGKSSLLASSIVYGDDNVILSAQSRTLIESLVRFHFMLCILEAKAGYVERSITLMQALLDVNTRSSLAESTDHLQLLQHFSKRWDQGGFRFGDDVRNPEGNFKLSGTEYVPSDSAFEDLVHQDCTSQLMKCNPPDEIRTESHANDLLILSRAHLRASARDKTGKGSLQVEGDIESESEDDVRLVYSNLHGYRIQMDDIDDAGEYERILSELRGTESSLARQETRKRKLEKKQAEINADIAGVRDERADYKNIDSEDEFVQWHLNENVQQQMQWKPLRPSIPNELRLLEEQPDRAALTDEIQPFIFQVPSIYRWTLVKQLLEIIGVSLSAPGSLHEVFTADTLYRDSFNNTDPLLGPILDALYSTSHKKLFLSALQRCELLQQSLISNVQVKKSTLHNPSKVVFIRNILNACSSKDFLRKNIPLQRLVIKTWIEFETRVALEASNSDLSQDKTRELCQRLLKLQEDEAGALDVDVMFLYAKMELQFGNLRQMNRVCDKTLASLQVGLANAQASRNFHQLIFLRVRNVFWPSSHLQSPDKISSSEYVPGDLTRLSGLYSLWSVWQSDVESLEQLQKQFKKKPHRLRDHLHQLLSPQTQSGVIEKYRIELEFASQQCEKNHATPKSLLEDTDGCHVGYCLHNLCLAVYASHGFDVGCNEYELYLDDLQSQTKCWHLQWTWFSYLEFMQQHQAAAAFPVLSPRKWRIVLGKAISIFPTNPTILRLFADAETSNTVSQTLRQYFLRVKQRRHRQFDSPVLVEWLFALLCELYRIQRSGTKVVNDHEICALDSTANMCCLLHKWQMNQTAIRRIRRVFEDMISQIRTQGSALAWRLYIRFEVAMGKIEAARKVFYRALAKCPWSKALYMDGVAVLRPYLSSDECHELMEFMTAKEIHVRVDTLQE